MRSTLVATLGIALLMAAAGTAPAIGSETPSATDLTNNTLVWPGPDGEPRMIHFGRFENFDRYVPCTFESGLWTLDSDGALDLTYDSPRIEAQRYVLTGKPPGAITMSSPGGETFVAELQEGDHLPWF